jgi:hypothetical protein
MKQPVQFRSASAAAQQAQAQQPPVSFANDIRPLFRQFQGPMMWRFDLTSYDAVRANAQLILGQISPQGDDPPSMPPPPFPPLTAEQIANFEAWIKAGFPP